MYIHAAVHARNTMAFEFMNATNELTAMANTCRLHTDFIRGKDMCIAKEALDKLCKDIEHGTSTIRVLAFVCACTNVRILHVHAIMYRIVLLYSSMRHVWVRVIVCFLHVKCDLRLVNCELFLSHERAFIFSWSAPKIWVSAAEGCFKFTLNFDDPNSVGTR